MERSHLGRRDFHRLTVAAMGGVVTGSLLGCPQPDPDAINDGTGPESGSTVGFNSPAPVQSEAVESTETVSLLLEDPHVCRGLNTCKGKGKEGDNACAGQGACASVETHACHTHNECKGQGGCGEHPGENDCKGQGLCSVPLMESAWDSARKNFESAMKQAGREVGKAPAKAG